MDALFPKRAKKYVRQIKGHVWCNDIMKEIREAIERANCMHLVCHSRKNQSFWVMQFDRPDQSIAEGVYRVNLRRQTCDCGRFETLRFSCAHAIAACSLICLDHMSFVDEVYKIQHMYNVWKYEFQKVPNEKNSYMFTTIWTHFPTNTAIGL
ncbi:hypothetical protein J1N35_039745 [Gossypium stocksii]|uniref:SWIM-type domain-containing protein n=1 Tax=Gossypium stocksii TaxID=47602 RepID=A0A9D3UCS9_9ROSI|nr:hypothetical protein J1N35_039745 [Gossypium stocksii]